MKERHTATRCMSFIMCVTILLLGKSSIIGEISVCIILDGIRQKIRIRKNADFFIQAAGLAYHHDAVVYIIKGGMPPLYLITRKRAFSAA